MILYTYVTATLIVASAYAFLIYYILHYWYKIDDTKNVQEKDQCSSTFSILIPARNEGQNIGACIESILACHLTPLRYELIIIDDHSEDNTLEVIQSYNSEIIKILELKDDIRIKEVNNSYKKAAINYGLSIAQYEYVIQLDADTIVPSDYFHIVEQKIREDNPDFIAGPVILSPAKSVIEQFQLLDYIGMMILTAAGIQSRQWHLANGANMIYRRSSMSTHDSDLASGDDIFAIQNFVKQGKKVSFLKSAQASILSPPQPDLTSLVSQRIRWGTKNKYMKSPSMQLMMVIPFANACWILLHLIMIFFYTEWAISLLVGHLLIKMASDYLLLDEGTRFFDQRPSMKYFLPANLLHIPYLAIVGWLSLFVKKYNWKGRKVS